MADLSLIELSELMGGMIAAPFPHKRKVLLCSPDVVARFREVVVPADRKPDQWFFSLSGLSDDALMAWATSIDIVTTEDVPPGWYRLTEHDHCQVRNADDVARAWVDCAECTIVCEGTLTA